MRLNIGKRGGKRVDVRPNWKEQPCASPSPRERAPRAHARVP